MGLAELTYVAGPDEPCNVSDEPDFGKVTLAGIEPATF